METINWTCGRANWSQLVIYGNWLWLVTLQGGAGGLRQTFVDFYLRVPPCHQSRAGSATVILESTKVCRRPPAPPCTAGQNPGWPYKRGA